MKEVLPKLAGSLKLSAHNWWGKIRKSQKQGLCTELSQEKIDILLKMVFGRDDGFK